MDTRSIKAFTRTTISFVVLSEDPIPDDMTFGEIFEECDTGDYVMGSSDISPEPITGLEMAQALTEAGSDPGFFQLDDDGRDT